MEAPQKASLAQTAEPNDTNSYLAAWSKCRQAGLGNVNLSKDGRASGSPPEPRVQLALLHVQFLAGLELFQHFEVEGVLVLKNQNYGAAIVTVPNARVRQAMHLPVPHCLVSCTPWGNLSGTGFLCAGHGGRLFEGDDSRRESQGERLRTTGALLPQTCIAAN